MKRISPRRKKEPALPWQTSWRDARRGVPWGFTILELLVSMAVLALLVVLVAQLTNSAALTITGSRKHMDADSQARTLLDRMSVDIAKMVKRKDADCIFYKGPQNDAMFFYSEAPAYYAYDTNTARGNKNSVALIGYRINAANPDYPNTPVLERLGMGLTWDGASSSSAPGGLVFLTALAGSAVPDPASTLDGNWSKTIGTVASGYSNGDDPGSYHVLGDLVYRMEIQFLLTDGTLSNIPVTNPAPVSANNLSASGLPTVSNGSPNYAPGSRWFDTSASRGYICASAAPGAAVWNPIGVQDISAIVVTLAVLDSNSRKIITGDITGVPLVDAVDATPVAKTWMAAINNSASFASASGIPQAAAAQVRIYQRTFYLNNP